MGVDLNQQNTGGFFSILSSVMKNEPTQPRTATPLPNLNNNSNSGDFFIRMSIDLLQNSKEYRRNEPFRTAITKALETLDKMETNQIIIFKPFQMACQSGSPELITIAIDCLGKLFTYNYWKFAQDVQLETQKKESDEDGDNDGTSAMIAFVIDTICDAFSGESTDEKVQLQIIKALQAAITNVDPAFSLHGAILLKAIRTTYNIFLLSKSQDVQIVAQGTVTQMVQNVFGRIPNPNSKKEERPLKRDDSKRILKENSDVNGSGKLDEAAPAPTKEENQPTETNRELKDAFKVFRTLCILGIKPIPTPEGTIDLRSQPIRSKLLALHLVTSVLQSHMYVFHLPAKALWELTKDPQGTIENFKFIDSVKEFLILNLSRNATSIVLPIFEISLDLFGKLWIGLRTLLKKEMAVFFTEIVIPILEAKKNIAWYQRYALLKALVKIFSEQQGGQMLVEIYLNYDCDVEATAKENIWERLMNAVSKITSLHVDPNSQPSQLISSFVHPSPSPALTTSNLVLLSREQVRDLFAPTGDQMELRKQGVKLMSIGILKPLLDWLSQRSDEIKEEKKTDSESTENTKSLGLVADEESSPSPTKPISEDDPQAILLLKQRKQNMIEGIKKFNSKPKKGIQFLLDTKCIASRTPRDIAKFLMTTEVLNKTQIGDFLGEGDEENIAIMHAFVENFEFPGMGFVDALRMFLQSFRLPGEAQKIDRFMLKFAEVFIKGNPTAFSSADTAYVLAYSVIMLNTDQHNSQVKRKMTKQDFLKNNRGIDGGKDIPEEVLGAIFDEISTNEIIMKDEQAKQNQKVADDAKESLVKRTETMAVKTEAMFRRGTTKKANIEGGFPYVPFISATHFAHVKPMFEIIWMSVLTGLSTPLQECFEIETVSWCLEGVRSAIRIACYFDMELEKQALLSTLSKFTLLNNMQEMRAKNFEAIKTLLEIAYQEGNHLDSSWKDVVSCISQLEKLQLVGESAENKVTAEQRRRDYSNRPGSKQTFLEEVAAAASSQTMTLSVDRIFTSSSRLSGTAIVHFVRALCETSWDEITTSTDKDQPRMYCLQRLVEISYYNMKRIRVEWSNIWAILGEHFNQVGCYPNTNVAYFALDKLRQLALKFLELEELPNFKFQKDFLRPFEEIVKNNPDPKIKDMCLVCIQQIIQIKGLSLKSGWKTLCGTLMRVARDTNEQIVHLSFDIAKGIFKNNLEALIINASLPDYVACTVEFCKNRKTAKINLYAIELLKQCIQKLGEMITVKPLLARNMSSVAAVVQSPVAATELPPTAPMHLTPQQATPPIQSTMSKKGGTLVTQEEDICIRYWMPVLFGLHDVIMSCDLEVRTRALQYLFETLKLQGISFSTSFWELLAKGVLFPIFEDMKQPPGVLNSKFSNKEDLSVWLSTTLIQALRQFVDLFTHYYTTLGFLLGNMFSLLKVCILHENEAMARIGSTCIQQLVEQNVKVLDVHGWTALANLFTELFDETAPKFLFFNFKGDQQSIDESQFSFLNKPLGPPPDRKDFQKQISKCVLHLLVVETLQNVMSTGPNDAVYHALPNKQLMQLLACFASSYQLAHVFNETMPLRESLFKMGYMKQLPNLLKQETMSANAYIALLVKVYVDSDPKRLDEKVHIEQKFISLCLEILNNYNKIDNDAKQRNIVAWRPVIMVILQGLVNFDDQQFKKHLETFYSPVISLLFHEMPQDIRLATFQVLQRTGKHFGLIKENVEVPNTSNETTSPPDDAPQNEISQSLIHP